MMFYASWVTKTTQQKQQTLVHIFAKYWSKIAIVFITNPNTSQRCRCATLCSISFQKLHRSKVQQLTADHARMQWRECACYKWGLFDTQNSTFCCHTDCFLQRSRYEVRKQTSAKELTEANRHVRVWDSTAQNSCWMMLYSFGSVIKGYSHKPHRTITEWLTVYASAATKNEKVEKKRLLHTRTTFSQSLMVTDGMSRLGYTAMIVPDPRLNVNETYCDLPLSQQ